MGGKTSKGLHRHKVCEKVLCSCGCRATYKASLDIKHLVPYNKDIEDERLTSYEGVLGCELVRLLVILKPYSHSRSSVNVRWTACEKCIKMSVAKYFYYEPLGWKEGDIRLSDPIPTQIWKNRSLAQMNASCSVTSKTT